MSQFPEAFTSADTYESALRTAAEMWGVQQDYWDIFGQHHFTPPEVQKAILRSMGVPCENTGQLNDAVEKRVREHWERPAPRTLVLSRLRDTVHVSVPEHYSGEIRAEFRWENGETCVLACPAEQLNRIDAAQVNGRRYVKRALRFPEDAPYGYHELHLQAGTAQSTTRLILAPDRTWSPRHLERGGKLAGIAISLYGLRSERNQGCGDFTDLRTFLDWMAQDTGADFAGLNPLHAIANREPYNTSPYLPLCTFYRNPLYIDIETVPDLVSSALCRKALANGSVQGRAAELRASQYVEYGKVWPLKLRLLKGAFRAFLRNEYSRNTERGRTFRAWIEQEGELLDRYAVYSALDEVLHKRDRDVWIWTQWPREFQDPNSEATHRFARERWRLVLFYKYMQWLVDEQLRGAQRHSKENGLTIGLYHDLALATDRFGSDLWAYRDFYVHGCRVGSPPDGFSPDGQDWAFPPPNAQQHYEDGYRLFAESIRKNARHGGALRIDHVMRFFRLFWIPDGMPAKQGAYVRERADDLLRVLALESVRNEFMVIGEDLGTVEPYIREALERYGVLSYRLAYFEKNKDESFKRPAQYPRQALVSASTHDLPTLSGFWSGADIDARRKATNMDDGSFQRQMQERAVEKQRLLDLLHQLNLLPAWYPRTATQVPELNGELHNAFVGFLSLTPSQLFVINQEDLFKDPDQQNLPGTTNEQYPNWRHKMRFKLEELRSNPFARDCAAMFRNWLEQSERVSS